MALYYVPDYEGEDWRARAEAVIPGGASTGSKRAAALYGHDTDYGPTHYLSAHGCRLVTTEGVALIDNVMALGAVAIGYGDEAVTQAVINAVTRGNVSGISHVLEVEVAERLTDFIPCAEEVRFLKSGAEGVQAAVRLARAYTNRSKVVGSGYFGWLDLWSEGRGIPAGVTSDFTSVPFDDSAALANAVRAAGDDLAAIIIEPVVERLPSEEWVTEARRWCTERGAILIFDEMKTGFRLATGGYQEYAKIEPDLAIFGKALANGFPLSAVVGRAAIMEMAKETWISSTLASEAVGLAAAAAVLDWHEKAEVCESLWSIGADLKGAVERAIAASRVTGVTVEGIAPMWFMRFDNEVRHARFLELALEEGVLFKRGAYNYASLAHDDETIAEVESAASSALVALRDEDDAGQ